MNHVGNPATVKARKNHRCNWCGETILRHFPYSRAFVVWEGDAWTKKLHTECRAAEEAYDFQGDDLLYEGQFQRGHNHEHNWANPQECAKHGCPACIAALRNVGKCLDCGILVPLTPEGFRADRCARCRATRRRELRHARNHTCSAS